MVFFFFKPSETKQIIGLSGRKMEKIMTTITSTDNTKNRTHKAVSPDGTEIVGRVVGKGPPLVLLHSGVFCGETNWGALLPHLTDRFTCSGGGLFALGAAEQSDAVTAVVTYEPAVFETIDEQTMAEMGAVLARMAKAVDQDRPAEAAREFLAFVCNDDELAALLADDLHEAAAPNQLADLRVLQIVDPTAPSATDPAALATITSPVLVLQGDRPALEWFPRMNQHVADHVPDCEVRTIPGAGHMGPVAAPEPIANEIAQFFS
jgi:hypothetical protein